MLHDEAHWCVHVSVVQGRSAACDFCIPRSQIATSVEFKNKYVKSIPAMFSLFQYMQSLWALVGHFRHCFASSNVLTQLLHVMFLFMICSLIVLNIYASSHGNKNRFERENYFNWY